jgi:hypothetical protein
MNDDTFARLVAEEVKNNVSNAQRDYLKLPENLHRWERSLQALLDNLDNQIKNINQQRADEIARYEAMGDDGFKLVAEAASMHDLRAKKISRFRFHVESKLDDVSRQIAMSSDDEEEKVAFVQFLRSAISMHKKMLEDNDLEATSIDVALWDALDGVWSFDNIDLSGL